MNQKLPPLSQQERELQEKALVFLDGRAREFHRGAGLSISTQDSERLNVDQMIEEIQKDTRAGRQVMEFLSKSFGPQL
jgi:hypothetical protein